MAGSIDSRSAWARRYARSPIGPRRAWMPWPWLGGRSGAGVADPLPGSGCRCASRLGLLALGLLLALLAWSAQVGAPWDHRPSFVLLPDPTPTATVAPAPTATPEPTPLPSTSGTGDQLVAGTETSVVLATAYTSTKVGDVTQLRGGVITALQTMNDRRVTGDATFTFSVDAYTNVGPEWGTYRLENAGGTWEGPCTGASWDGGNKADGTCWLVGSGSYKGFTYYFHHTYGLGDDLNVQGIIFPGSPPTP